MPEFFDVTDDPTKPLFGHEEVDDEGVPDKPLSLVEKGVLKDFLRTASPCRGYNDSNGRARLSANYGAETPVPTNLLIRARETSSIAELKKKLIDLIQQRGLPYGMIVRKMDFPSSASIDEARRILSAGAAGGSSRPVSMPLYAYVCIRTGARNWCAASASRGSMRDPQRHPRRRRRQRDVQLSG